MKTTTSLNQVGGECDTGKPKKCGCKWRIIIAAVFAVLVISVVCEHFWHHVLPKTDPGFALKPGMQCTVQLRRDIMGAGMGPIDPFNKQGVSLEGRLIAMSADAILLDVTDVAPVKFILGEQRVPRHAWIPRSNILFIDYYLYSGELAPR